LELNQLGINDYFHDLGGDSLLAAALMAKIGEHCDQQLPFRTLIQASTVAKMADILHQEKLTLGDSALGAIQPNGARPPFFCVPGIGGQALGFTAFVA
jgi:hypothetical protein